MVFTSRLAALGNSLIFHAVSVLIYFTIHEGYVRVFFHGMLNRIPGTWHLAGHMCDTLADDFNHPHHPCVEGTCVTLGTPPADIW